MRWNRMTVLRIGMLLVCVSCKPTWGNAFIIRIKLSFGCGEVTMVNLKLKWILLIPG